MAHFYLAEHLTESVVGSRVELTGDEAHHAVAVSRVRSGEKLKLGNGRGLVLDVTVVDANRDCVTCEIVGVEHVPSPDVEVTLVQALTKGDRDERAIEAATELGIDSIIPWAADRSVSIWTSAKAQRGVERWQAIVREATKQCMRAYVPSVKPHATTTEVISQLDGAQVFVLDPTEQTTNEQTTNEPEWRAIADRARHEGQPVAIVIGPEGGITATERAQFVAAGASCVRLGRNILRSSTAGPAFLSAINGALGRW